MVIGIASLYGIARLLARMFHSKTRTDLNNSTKDTIVSQRIKEITRFEKAIKFIFGIIVGQGGILTASNDLFR